MPLKDLLFGFEGRIRRRTWWLASLTVSFCYLIAVMAAGMLVFGSDWNASAYWSGTFGAGDWRVLAFDVIGFLPVMWIQCALAAKRAHDRADGAALAVALTLLAGIISFAPMAIDLTVGAALGDGAFDTLGLALNIVTMGANLYLFIVLGCMDGTRGPNRFGRSPKGIGGDPADTAAEVFS